MSFNIRDYVSDDHVESIGEIAKSQSAIIQALSLDNSQKDKEIERLNHIIDKQDRDITTLTKCKIKLKYIINELEKWIKENDLGKYRTENVVDTDELLDKLQELKGENENE